ncbi:MAG: hypothetical protein WC371_02165 [Parachlamydiales bacterium]|jgi:hypothetical protein
MPLKPYSAWIRWPAITAGHGVLVALSSKLEWILPWWWHFYASHNSYPVTFVDFGLSKKAQKWCREKGSLVRLKSIAPFMTAEKLIDQNLMQDWRKWYGAFKPQMRKCWFQKPLAMLQSPYQKTLWLDIDCQIRGPLEPLFQALENFEIACMPEDAASQKIHRRFKLTQKDQLLYNSGVVAYIHGSKTIEAWAKAVPKNNHLFFGDQDLFSEIVYQNQTPVHNLPPTYNALLPNGFKPQDLIRHYMGSEGKQQIGEMTRKLHDLAFCHDFHTFFQIQKSGV